MAERRKIAVLIDWYLPGTRAGGPVRSVFSLLQVLKDRFDFYVITKNTDLGSDEPYNSITPDKLFLKEGVHYYYFSKAKLGQRTMQQLLTEIRPSLIYLNSF